MKIYQLIGGVVLTGVAFAGGYYSKQTPPPVEVIKTVTVTALPIVPTPTPDNHAQMTVDNLMIRFNEVRLANGLKQAISTEKLNTVAQGSAQDLCKVGQISHEYVRKYNDAHNVTYGEIVAYNYITPLDTVNGWLNSPTHKSILLDAKVKWIGLGITPTGVNNIKNCVSIIVSN